MIYKIYPILYNRIIYYLKQIYINVNKGYLNIVSKKRDFELIKTSEIGVTEPKYAKTTFNGLFPFNSTKTNKKKLQFSYYRTLDSAMNSLKKTHSLYSASHYISNSFYIIALVILYFINISENGFIRNYVITGDVAFLNTIYKVLFYIASILNIIYIVFNKKMRQESYDLYNEIMGFRDFLKKVEKEKLELLVEENPNYFYDILPYAYVLGISRKWSKKFEFIPIQEASWYTGSINNNVFNAVAFTRSFNQTLMSVSAASSSRPTESSGSSSGGGSFSGGGGSSGGGGGGSSW